VRWFCPCSHVEINLIFHVGDAFQTAVRRKTEITEQPGMLLKEKVEPQKHNRHAKGKALCSHDFFKHCKPKGWVKKGFTECVCNHCKEGKDWMKQMWVLIQAVILSGKKSTNKRDKEEEKRGEEKEKEPKSMRELLVKV